MNFKAWKLGVFVALLLSLMVAGAGLSAGMKWQSFVAVFCTACLTHLGSFLVKHPPESVSFETVTTVADTHTEKTTVTPTETKTP